MKIKLSEIQEYKRITKELKFLPLKKRDTYAKKELIYQRAHGRKKDGIEIIQASTNRPF